MKLLFYSLSILALVSGVGTYVSTDSVVKTVEAQQSCGSIEVVAGESGSINGLIQSPFSGLCKNGTISSFDGVNFDNQYLGTVWCSNGMSEDEYATQNYDATSFPGNVSLPATFYTSIEAVFDTGGECEVFYATIEVTVVSGTPPGPSFTCDVIQATATVDAGSDTSYTINTTPVNGFSSPVNFTASVSPSATSTPDVSFTNNGQTPAAVTTANVTTTSNTSVATYTITFTGTGGSYSTTCGAQLIVNPAQGDFELVIQPSTGILPNTNPNRVNIGTNAVFTVFAECSGGFSGNITNMSATTTFTGPVATLGASTLACGSTTSLTISNTGSIPEAQQSTINQILSEAISVTGSAQL